MKDKQETQQGSRTEKAALIAVVGLAMATTLACDGGYLGRATPPILYLTETPRPTAAIITPSTSTPSPIPTSPIPTSTPISVWDSTQVPILATEIPGSQNTPEATEQIDEFRLTLDYVAIDGSAFPGEGLVKEGVLREDVWMPIQAKTFTSIILDPCSARLPIIVHFEDPEGQVHTTTIKRYGRRYELENLPTIDGVWKILLGN